MCSRNDYAQNFDVFLRRKNNNRFRNLAQKYARFSCRKRWRVGIFSRNLNWSGLFGETLPMKWLWVASLYFVSFFDKSGWFKFTFLFRKVPKMLAKKSFLGEEQNSAAITESLIICWRTEIPLVIEPWTECRKREVPKSFLLIALRCPVYVYLCAFVLWLYLLAEHNNQIVFDWFCA